MPLKVIKTPNEAIETIKNSIRYGWKSKDGTIFDGLTETKETYRTMNPFDSFTYGIGTSIEKAELFAMILVSMGIDHNKYVARTFDEEGNLDDNLNCLVTYKDGEKIAAVTTTNTDIFRVNYDSEEEAVKCTKVALDVSTKKTVKLTQYGELPNEITIEEINSQMDSIDKIKNNQP